MSTLVPVIEGRIEAPILCLDAPISFWGGVDMETGRIIDRSHPQAGQHISGYCLVVPMIRGSGGTPGNLAMTIKLGFGPSGIVIGYPDVNVMAGVVVARHLYARNCPMFVATDEQRANFYNGATAVVEPDGAYSIR